MRASFVRSALRVATAGSLGVGVVSASQAFACHAWYEALPDATGPTSGVATPCNSNNTPIAAVAEWRKSGAVTGGFRGGSGEGRGGMNMDEGLEEEPMEEFSRGTEKPKRGKKNHGKPALRLWIIGDSLVTGVGASCAANGFGPVLPRILAERVSYLTDRQVEWTALGKKAADVRTIRHEIVRNINDAGSTTRGSSSNGSISGCGSSCNGSSSGTSPNASSNGRIGSPGSSSGSTVRLPPPDVVVLLCGVNDLKRAFSGRTPERFRLELRKAVRDVREVFEDKTKREGKGTNRKQSQKHEKKTHPLVVLPGMPMQLVTAFPLPLSALAAYAGDVWDDQKRLVAEEDSLFGMGGGVLMERDDKEKNEEEETQKKSYPRTLFVPKPSTEVMQIFGDKNKSLTAKDGIHPNEWGYAAWASHIAGEVAVAIEKREKATSCMGK